MFFKFCHVLKLITIFTPTYNRAYCLTALYQSLCNQTIKNFEWVIVDDGSSDNTEELIKSWIGNSDFNIIYHKQKNSGKYKAINKGVSLASGELFFIVDSDDVLPETSISIINKVYDGIKNDNSFGGLCGLKCYLNGVKVGGEAFFDVLDCTSLEFRYKYKATGDMAEVIRTDVMREFPFPDFGDERFCPEALLFNRIATKYKLRYFNKDIYHCEYLSDGLTASIIKIRMKSPLASTTFYSELFFKKIPFAQKIKAAINYWRFAFCMKDKKNLPSIGVGALCKPLGFLYHLKDSRL